MTPFQLPPTAIKFPGGEGRYPVPPLVFEYWQLEKRRYASITTCRRGVVMRHPEGGLPPYIGTWDGVPVGDRYETLKAARQAVADWVAAQELV